MLNLEMGCYSTIEQDTSNTSAVEQAARKTAASHNRIFNCNLPIIAPLH
jgi:hypothetical protein